MSSEKPKLNSCHKRRELLFVNRTKNERKTKQIEMKVVLDYNTLCW